ncbi:DDB1- and CUL4-associated factor 4 WD repeat-containing protein 21A [Triplophysa tibetana]|uniref:DDB1-and CUL4-associated factor 4 WD repeat-containing protein 21A n=1 Tax=Triplophysa tibetana TaxID=1572043 RepID=A0A5A9NGT7_9TELE|nr:DDB1- and CUL4-associated factor 4 WD repeat-containing protein 21A [Triplophysa tibetana]
MKRGHWRSGWRKKRLRSNNDEQENGSNSTADTGTADTGTADTGTADDSGPSSQSITPAPELPGFYYDPEKKRYFRLLPGHNNCNPLTKEGLQKKQDEITRLALLAEDDAPVKKAPRAGLNSALLLQKRHLGLLPPSSYSRFIHEVKVTGMQRHKLDVQSSNSTSPNTDNFHLIVADSACERVFTVNDVSHGGCKYGIMDFQGCRKGSLSVEMCDNLYFTNRKTPGCVSLLPASLFSNLNPDQPGMLCSFKISTAWSCAWCLNPQADKTFSTGLSRRVILTDAVTGRRATYSSGSEVLAQQFTLRAPVLFNGCRSGEIFSIDLRQRDRGRSYSWQTSRFFQESSITSLKLLQDENYLLAADMLGQIKLWDIRIKRCVRQYEGHDNKYAYLPIHVNEPEDLLLAAGQDCYTRLWSLRDGHLLRTIPSPHPAGKDSIPNVVFSSQLGGSKGPPGLLMAVRNDLYYYSYNKDYQDGSPVKDQC